MKISYNHIKKFLSNWVKDELELKNKLNQMWLEVESTKKSPDWDTIFDVEITPNRPDLLNYVGISREILATTDVLLDPMSCLTAKEYQNDMKPMKNNLSNPALCPAFYARKIKWIKLNSTPAWMVDLLQKHDIASINILVDITNYIMIELWQPMHAYDTNILSWNIMVGNLPKDSEVECLDWWKRKLTWEEIIILDEWNNFLGIWWIMWWEKSKITENTTDVTLESAYFDPVSIRFSSRRLKTSTDASYRFERWINPTLMQFAINMATDLVLEICGWTVVEDYGYNTLSYTPKQISLKYSYVNRLLGIQLSKDFVKDALIKFWFTVINDSDDDLKVQVPAARYHDIKFDTCLVEEVGKVYGFDNIPAIMPTWELLMAQKTKENAILVDVEKFFITNWYNEVINFAFLSPKCYEWFGLSKDSELFNFVEIEAPLGEEFSVMRTSLIPGLLRNLDYNINRWVENMKIFEAWRIFHPVSPDKKPLEINMISWLVSSKEKSDNWKNKYNVMDLYDLKSMLFAMLFEAGIETEKIVVKKSINQLLEEGNSMDFYVNDKLVWSAWLLKTWAFYNKRVKYPVYVFEFNYDILVAQIESRSYAKYTDFSLFPSSFKDVDFVCDKSFESKLIIDEMYKLGNWLIKSVELFDVYEWKGIPEWFVSMTFNMEFQHKERSLTWEEVIEIFNKIIESVTSKYEVKLRNLG